jgi:hypothetical protein
MGEVALLPKMTPDGIQHIRIKYPGKPAIALLKKYGHWYLMKPVQTPADDSQVDVITSLVSMTAVEHFPVKGAKLDEMSLTPPKWKIWLNKKVLAFGGKEPIKGHRYIRIGKTIYLVPLLVSAPFNSDYADLVDHNLIPPNEKLQSVKTTDFTLSKNDKGKWQLNHKPENAAPNAAATLALAWSNARGQWVTALKKQGKNQKPSREAEITLSNGKTFHYQQIKDRGQPALARKDLGVAYHITDKESAKLFKIPQKEKPGQPKANNGNTAAAESGQGASPAKPAAPAH